MRLDWRGASLAMFSTALDFDIAFECSFRLWGRAGWSHVRKIVAFVSETVFGARSGLFCSLLCLGCLEQGDLCSHRCSVNIAAMLLVLVLVVGTLG